MNHALSLLESRGNGHTKDLRAVEAERNPTGVAYAEI
jgi:hypothetical protein